MSGEEGCDDVCGCRMSGELNGVRNGRRRGIVETTRVQAVDLEKRRLDDVNDDGGCRTQSTNENPSLTVF